jgi:hypothetical protein
MDGKESNMVHAPQRNRPRPQHTTVLVTRHRHALAHWPVLLAPGLLFAWLSAAGPAAAGTSELSGEWQMDKELSEDPLEKMRERPDGGLRGGGGGRAGGMGGGRGGMGGGRGGGMRGGGSQGPGQSRAEMRQKMQELRASLERLQITQTDSTVRIVYGDNREQILPTDNEKAAIDTPFGEGTIRAKWRGDGGLVVKTKTERRKTTETYYVTKDGLLLTVLVEMAGEGPMSNTSYKRIYRPVVPDAEAGGPAAPS